MHKKHRNHRFSYLKIPDNMSAHANVWLTMILVFRRSSLSCFPYLCAIIIPNIKLIKLYIISNTVTVFILIAPVKTQTDQILQLLSKQSKLLNKLIASSFLTCRSSPFLCFVTHHDIQNRSCHGRNPKLLPHTSCDFSFIDFNKDTCYLNIFTDQDKTK